MSSDTVTEVTSESWFGRIGGAIKGVVFGLVLFAIAFPLLFWNEGRAVQEYKTLREGGGAVVPVKSDRVDPANAGKLIHVTGQATADSTLSDAVFGVSAKALKLKRAVEMYQWEEKSQSETKKKLGGGTETVTTYTYAKTWSSGTIDSADFKEPSGHQNPGSMPYESSEQVAQPITLGAFTVSPSLVGRIDDFEPLSLGAGTAVPESLKYKAKLQGTGFYVGVDPASPQVGDTRVEFSVARPTEVSVIAQQAGNSFAPYKAAAGGTIELLQTGVHSADSMIKAAQEANKVLAWILRGVGFLVMLMALNMILRPFSVAADVVPFVGRIVGAGTGFISFLVAAALSLTTIAIAWIFYRPLIGLTIVAVTVALIAIIVVKLRSAKPALQTT